MTAKLAASRHEIVIRVKEVGGKLRVPNLNELLLSEDWTGFDWIITVDDDVELPDGFMDSFIFLMERFGLMIAQPAHNLVSYASFEVNRRAWGTLARRTGFVEVGPLTAFHRSIAPQVLPFPDVGMGHGLDVHWAFLADRHGWPIGVIDALPLRHLRPVGTTYDSAPIRREALRFIAERGGLPRRLALRTLESFRTL